MGNLDETKVKNAASDHIRQSITSILRTISQQLPPGYLATLIIIAPDGGTYAASTARDEAVPFILREAASQVEKGQISH